MSDVRNQRPPGRAAAGDTRRGAPTRRIPRADGSGYDWAYDDAPPQASDPQQPADGASSRGRGAVAAASVLHAPASRAPGPRAPGPNGDRGAPGDRPVVPPGRPAVRPQAPTGPAGPPGSPRRRRRRHPIRAVLVALLLIVVLLGGGIAALGGYAWSKVAKTAALPASGAIADTPGTNYLIVGSDSRAGLTAAQRKALHTGNSTDIAGQRTDTILVLHSPAGGGKQTLVSIPRDSYVAIPGHAKNKINAAFAIGGAPLLVRTVEGATGVHIDHYVEVGFGGFANLVDEVNGVRLCLPKAINDAKAHIDLPKGCQTLSGANALGYVRARYSDPRGDLGRVDRQRQFVSALLSRATSTGTLLNPGRLWGLAGAGGSALTVDEGMHWWQAVSLVRAARAATSGGGNSITVPNDGSRSTRVGSVVGWDPTLAPQLWTALRDDKPVPEAVVRAGR